jgi:hypothetical protein
MRSKVPGLLLVGVLGPGFAQTVGTPAALMPKAVPVAASAEAAAVPAAANPAEPDPQIREAIAALRRAKEHMEHARMTSAGIA